MLKKQDILLNLHYLDKNYCKAKGKNEPLLLAKLAVLELGGWIEEAMEDIVLCCANRCKLKTAHQKIVEDRIKNNHNIKYENFREMLTTVIGLVNFDKIEKSSTKATSLEGTLGSIKAFRDKVAHTHTVATTNINAPSTTIQQFNVIYEGLEEFDRALQKFGF